MMMLMIVVKIAIVNTELIKLIFLIVSLKILIAIIAFLNVVVIITNMLKQKKLMK